MKDPDTSFEAWLRSFSWLFEPNLPCVVSADLDGVACALLQFHALGWRCVGTYDGKVVNCFESPQGIPWHEVVFLDVEILRPEARSLGNHLFALDKEDVASLREEFPDCASPNLWRGITVRDSFQQKYPFSTLPLLLAARSLADTSFAVSDAWLALTLHTDSSFTNAAQYQENALSWLAVMGAGNASSPLKRFCTTLARLRAQEAIRMLHRVQTWAREAGFGAKERACRFDAGTPGQREKAIRLVERLVRETGAPACLSLAQAPVYREEFETHKLPLDSQKRQRESFAAARHLRALSMAATGRNAEGLSFTLPRATSTVPLFR